MSEQSGVETVRVKLPTSFDPTKHLVAVEKKITETHGDGFQIVSIDGAKGGERFAVAERRDGVTQVFSSTNKRKTVTLGKNVKSSDGDRQAAILQENNPGYYLTKFEPFLYRAEMTMLTPDEVRCREAIALVIGCKPWDVSVASRLDGGFEVGLPAHKYQPRHNEKIEEVATEVVGEDGWYVKVNARQLTASLIPSKPPTFPSAIGTPMKRLGRGKRDFTPFGMKLPSPGQEVGEEIGIDWTAQAFAMLAGMPGSGKRHPLTTRVPVPVSAKYPSGWATVGDLEVGDEVFAIDGSVTTVDYLSPVVERKTYRITFSDGQAVEADAEHLWSVSDRRSRHAHYPRQSRARSMTAQKREQRAAAFEQIALEHKPSTGASASQLAVTFGISMDLVRSVVRAAALVGIVGPGKGSPKYYPVDEFASALASRVRDSAEGLSRWLPITSLRTTAEIAKAVRVGSDARSNFAVRTAAPLDLAQVDLPVDPYLLGAWLGDGTTRSGGITVGLDDLADTQARLEDAWGHPVSRTEESKGAVTLHFGRPDQALCLRGHDSWSTFGDDEKYCADCRTGEQDSEFKTNDSLSNHLRDLGVRGDKHIPASYLRASESQRLALLQGLMDTDGTISPDGASEFCVTDERLAGDVLELVRSLGIHASMSSGDAVITTVGESGERVRRVTGTRYRVQFTTSTEVFRMARKAQFIPVATRTTSDWNYIVSVEETTVKPGRCIRITHPEHLYLVEGFIPTHNTVTLNALIADAKSNGAELVIVDDQAKAVDFMWCRDLVRPGGWGCDSVEAAVATLSLVYEEGKRRAEILAEGGYVNWTEMPKGQQFTPIFIVVDEVSALLVTDKIPSGVPKDHPDVVELIQMNYLKFKLRSLIGKIIAEQRFVGMRMVISTQVTNNDTGVPPSLKAKIGHKILQGVNPSKTARQQAFSDEAAVPLVPENVRNGGDVARGVGVADLEGDAPVVYKSYFATTGNYRERLISLGAQPIRNFAPTPAQIAKYAPDLNEEFDDSGFDSGLDGGGWGEQDGRDKPEPKLRGAAAASHALKVEAAAAR